MFKVRTHIESLLATVFIFILLLLLFYVLEIQTPNPIYPQEVGSGIDIKFGESIKSDEKLYDIALEQAPENPPTEILQEEVLTQMVEDAPEIVSKPIQKVTENNTPPAKDTFSVIQEQKPDQELLDAMQIYKGALTTTDLESSTATEQGSYQGSKTGTELSDESGLGTGFVAGAGGDGMSYQLSNRKLVYTPKIYDETQETGKVVVDIWVDQSGQVIKAVAGARGSTTANAGLYEKAVDAALKTQFDTQLSREVQKGQITFIFVVN